MTSDIQKTLAPDKDLFIYVVEGNINERAESRLGPGFIGNWVEGESSFLFFSKPSDREVEKLLQSNKDLSMSDRFHFTYEDWQGGRFDSLTIDPFVIIPPWEKKTDYKDKLKIKLDPGVVFGNGLHPTTRDCLKALYLASNNGPLGSVLDLGTGSGILSLAAAFLGAEKVLAVDLNPLCVKTAENNTRINGQEKRISVVQGTAEDHLNHTFDLVVANIHYDVIRNLINGVHLNRAGRLIISGQMRSQAREIKPLLVDSGYMLLKEWDQEMTWYTMLFKKRQISGTC